MLTGRSLRGWHGNEKLWRAEDGMLIGETTGLANNEFLWSELEHGDFVGLRWRQCGGEWLAHQHMAGRAGHQAAAVGLDAVHIARHRCFHQ